MQSGSSTHDWASSMPQRGPLIFLAVVLAALLPFLVWLAWPFVTSLTLAAILAIVVGPLQDRLNRRVHSRAATAFLVTIATVFALGLLVAFTTLVLTQELTAAYDALNRRSLEEGGWPALVTHTTDQVVDSLSTHLPVDKEAIRTELLDGMKTASGYLLNNTTAAIGGVTTALITGLLVMIFLYFFLRYGREWVSRLTVLIPLDARISTNILRTVHNSVVANVNGVLGRSYRTRCAARPRVLVRRPSITRALGLHWRTGFHYSDSRSAVGLGPGGGCVHLLGSLLEGSDSRHLGCIDSRLS